jgi:hypothetical protein
MSTRVQLRRGNTSQTSAFTGALAEITVDTDLNTLVIHDGVTPGGTYLTTATSTIPISDKANLAFNNAASASTYANTGINNAASASTYANSAFYNAASASTYANTALNNAASASTYANTGIDIAQASFNAANNVMPQIQPSFDAANTGINNAASASTYANTGINNAASASTYANTGINNAASASTYANTGINNAASASEYANTGINNAASASTYANTGIDIAQASFNAANNVMPQIQPSFDAANSASTYANTALNNAASASTYANTGINNAASASTYANTGINNAASASEYANTKVNKSGDTITGPIIISNTGTGALQVAGTVTIEKDLNVSGNVFISGGATTISSNNLTITDPIIYLAEGNIANTSDIGIVGNITNGHYYHTGLVRDHLDGTWKFFSNVIAEPTTTVDFSEANTIYDVVKVGGIISPSALINGRELGTYTQLAFNQANTGINNAASASLYANNALSYLSSNNTIFADINATQNTNITTATNNAASASLYANNAVRTGFTSISSNGSSITTTANNDTLTITSTTANGINVLHPDTKTIDFGLRNSGVTSGTYGGSTQIPAITIDSFGRITSASNNAISTTISLGAGTGTGSVSGGGTLTISGGTGITTSVSGSTYTINNSGVTSVTGTAPVISSGGATPAISMAAATTSVSGYLTSTDWTTFNGKQAALGYTPANLTGATFTGNINVPSITTNTSSYLTSTSFTTASTVQVAIDTLATATYRSAKYEIQMTSATSYHVIELRVVHDGTSVLLNQYGEMFTGSSLGTFDSTITAGTLSLLFTGTNAITTIKLVRTALVV